MEGLATASAFSVYTFRDGPGSSSPTQVDGED